jgi:hypothetical protein
MQTQTKEQTNPVEMAQAKIQSIQNALIGGNTKLTPRDLADAQSALEFARLQQRAAEISKQKTAEAQRLSLALGLEKQLASVAESRSGVDKKFVAFEKSLADYLSACSDYQRELNEIRNSLQTNGMYPGETVGLVGGIAPPDVVPGVKVTDVRRRLTINSSSAESVLPSQEISAVTEKALGEYSRNF